jgi:hypothetical protein
LLTAKREGKQLRTTTLLGAAVAVGVIGGVGTGYAVQAARPATPPPPLAQTQPAYQPTAVYQGAAPAMLPSSQDDAALTDGSLVKLLLPTPAGATTEADLWDHESIDIEQNADLCDNAVNCFSDDLGKGVVAIADTNWERNGYHYEIRITRYAAGESNGARSAALDYSNADGSFSLPAGVEGSGGEFYDKYDYNDRYASAVHGDLLVDFWVSSPSTVPATSLIDDVITQQMGRL